MRKFKALIAVLTAAVLVFSLVGTAFAAGFPDVSGVNGDAANRIRAFGIVDGYTDGTFHPNENVTREQFCKMVVNAIGQNAMAEAMKNQNVGGFKDVRPGAIFTGYINVAYALDIIKGYPDNTFRGANPVSYYEALLMLTRAIEQAKDTDAKTYATALRLGLMANVTASSSGYATRGHLAQMVSNTLNANVDMNGSEAGSPKPLEYYLQITSVGGSVYQTPMVADLEANQVKIQSNTVTVPADKLALNANDLVGAPVTYYLKGGSVVYLELQAGYSVVSGVYKEKDKDGKLVLDNGAKIEVATAAKYFVNGNGPAASATLAAGDKIWAYVKDGKADNIGVLQLNLTSAILSKDATVASDGTVTLEVYDKDGTKLSNVGFTKAPVVLLNGSPAKTSDLKKDDVIYALDAGTNKLSYVEAYRGTVAGKVTSYVYNAATGDVSIKLDSGAQVKLGDYCADENYAKIGDRQAYAKELIGKQVTIVKDKDGSARKIIPAAAAQPTVVYGKYKGYTQEYLTDDQGGYYQVTFSIDVGGTVKDYVYAPKLRDPYAPPSSLAANDYVKFALDKDGKVSAQLSEVTTLDKSGTIASVDTTNKRILFDGGSYVNVADNAVFYDKDGNGIAMSALKTGDSLKYYMDSGKLVIGQVQ